MISDYRINVYVFGSVYKILIDTAVGNVAVTNGFTSILLRGITQERFTDLQSSKEFYKLLYNMSPLNKLKPDLARNVVPFSDFQTLESSRKWCEMEPSEFFNSKRFLKSVQAGYVQVNSNNLTVGNATIANRSTAVRPSLMGSNKELFAELLSSVLTPIKRDYFFDTSVSQGWCRMQLYNCMNNYPELYLYLDGFVVPKHLLLVTTDVKREIANCLHSILKSYDYYPLTYFCEDLASRQVCLPSGLNWHPAYIVEIMDSSEFPFLFNGFERVPALCFPQESKLVGEYARIYLDLLLAHDLGKFRRSKFKKFFVNHGYLLSSGSDFFNTILQLKGVLFDSKIRHPPLRVVLPVSVVCEARSDEGNATRYDEIDLLQFL